MCRAAKHSSGSLSPILEAAKLSTGVQAVQGKLHNFESDVDIVYVSLQAVSLLCFPSNSVLWPVKFQSLELSAACFSRGCSMPVSVLLVSGTRLYAAGCFAGHGQEAGATNSISYHCDCTRR